MRSSQRKRRNSFGDDGPPGTPSDIKAWPPPWSIPEGYGPENPVPPTDPRYRPAWERAMVWSAQNFPDDPTYAPWRFRARNGDDGGKGE